MLELPLSLKYACPAPTTWRLAVSCLLDVLKEGLVTARQHRQHSANVWPRLAACLEAFLFSQRCGRRQCVRLSGLLTGGVCSAMLWDIEEWMLPVVALVT